MTEESKNIVSLVKDIQNDNVTMNHVIDVFRGLKHSKILSHGHDRLEQYGCGRNWKKQEADRLFRMLIIKQILIERCELNGMGFPMSYLQLGAERNLPTAQKIFLTLTTDDTLKSSLSSSSTSKSSSASSGKDAQVTCYRALAELRNDVITLLALNFRLLKPILFLPVLFSKTVYF